MSSPDLRAAEAAGRAVRRRARAPAAAVRRGLGAASRSPSALVALPRARRRRLPPLTAGEPRDDPHARRGRGALRHGAASCAPSSQVHRANRATRRRLASRRTAGSEEDWLRPLQAGQPLTGSSRGGGARSGAPAPRSSRFMFARCRTRTAMPATTPNAQHRPRFAEPTATARAASAASDRGDRGIAKREEDDQPDRQAAAADERRHAEEGAAAGRDHLAAASRSVRKSGRAVAEHRRAAREHAGEVPDA